MNFLAHLYLSGSDEDIMVGNFAGDFIKGRQALLHLPPKIKLGVELHRHIDEFTDKHAIVDESKRRLRPKYRHYAGIIVDIFYDHYLAKNWHTYANKLLPDFADHCYQILESRKDLPKEMSYMLPYMVKGNWLVNYTFLQGIERALKGMSNRTKYDSKMNESIIDLQEHYNAFKKEFETFFPELIGTCNQFLNEHQLPQIKTPS